MRIRLRSVFYKFKRLLESKNKNIIKFHVYNNKLPLLFIIITVHRIINIREHLDTFFKYKNKLLVVRVQKRLLVYFFVFDNIDNVSEVYNIKV